MRGRECNRGGTRRPRWLGAGARASRRFCPLDAGLCSCSCSCCSYFCSTDTLGTFNGVPTKTLETAAKDASGTAQGQAGQDDRDGSPGAGGCDAKHAKHAYAQPAQHPVVPGARRRCRPACRHGAVRRIDREALPCTRSCTRRPVAVCPAAGAPCIEVRASLAERERVRRRDAESPPSLLDAQPRRHRAAGAARHASCAVMPPCSGLIQKKKRTGSKPRPRNPRPARCSSCVARSKRWTSAGQARRARLAAHAPTRLRRSSPCRASRR